MLVLAKGTYRLGGNIAVLAEALDLAAQLDSPVAADWKGGMYRVDDANVAELLFEHPKLVPLPADLRYARIWPPEWAGQIDLTIPQTGIVNGLRLGWVTTTMAKDYGLDNLKRDFDVIVITRDSAKWYGDDLVPHVKALIPNGQIRARVRELGIRPTDIGVHFRHGNGEPTVVPPDILWFHKMLEKFLEQSPDARIFLCTDSSAVISRFAEHYGQKILITSQKKYPPLGAGGMHYETTSERRLESAIEAAVDMWALGQCGYFVGTESFFGRVARKLAYPMPKSHVAALGKRQVHKPNPGYNRVTQASDLGQFLRISGIRLDGLYINSEATKRTLYYLSHELGAFIKPEELDLGFIKERLDRLRLY